MSSNFRFTANDGSTLDMDDYYVPKSQFYVNPIYAAGENFYGTLGLNDTVVRSVLTPQLNSTGWSKISLGSHVLAIKTNGTLWAWGENLLGALGLGNTTNRSSPTQVGTLTNWSQVYASVYNSYAIKTDGTLWAWGNGTNGQLGNNSAAHRSSPVQIGTLQNWKYVVGNNQTAAAAIKTDGTLWTWGSDGTTGQLGSGTVGQSRSSPVQVGTLTNWDSLGAGGNFFAAIKTDGTLWTWGSNGVGQLGLNDVVHRSSPTQVGSLTDWKEIKGTITDSGITGASSAIALKNNNTLWSWGYNGLGELGLSNIVHRSSPTQIGALTNWKKFDCGQNAVHAIDTSGNLWGWGDAAGYGLGTGSFTDRSSPVLVSYGSWIEVATGGTGGSAIQFVCAIKDDTQNY